MREVQHQKLVICQSSFEQALYLKQISKNQNVDDKEAFYYKIQLKLHQITQIIEITSQSLPEIFFKIHEPINKLLTLRI